MNPPRSATLRVAGLVSALTLLVGCGSADSPSDDSDVTLVVGDVGGWLEGHLDAAGLLEDLPYEIEFKDVAGANAYSTLSAGQIDAGVWGFDANGASTIVAGSDARIIGLIGRGGDTEEDREQGNINLFVDTAAGIEEPADLAGHTIGVNWGQGTTADVVLHAALAEGGLTPADLEVKYFADATGNTAYLSDQLDGFVTSVNGPLVEDVESGGSSVAYYANEASAVAYVITSRTQVIDEKAEALADFVTRVTRYYDWRGEPENAEAFAEAVAQQQSLDAELAAKVADEIARTVQVQPFTDDSIAAYQDDIDSLLAWGLIEEEIDVHDLIDTSFADSIDAARE